MPPARRPGPLLGIIRDCREADIDPKRPRSKQQKCLYSKGKPSKLLGRHPNYKSALKQERAIQIRKRGG
jgi:hypothetical protein